MFAASKSGRVAGGDPYWSNVSLLLPGDGTNGAQNNTFIDSSASALTVTRNGDTTQGSKTKYTIPANTSYTASAYGGSGYFDGSGDSVSVPGTTLAIASSSTPFTVEAWVYPTATPDGSGVVCEEYTGSSNNVTFALGFCSGTVGSVGGAKPFFGAYNGSSWTGAADSANITNNTWTHLAGVYDGTNYKLYVNGTNVATTAGSALTATPDTVYVGRRWDTGGTASYVTGYVEDARVVIGTAVYTGNFTPPTAPLTAITNTKLLCGFQNAAIYDSAAKIVLRTGGNTQLSTAQKKFGTASMYFDGTSGTYLWMPLNDALDFGTDVFTIEFWMQSSGTQTAYSTIMDRSTNAPNVGTTISGQITNGTYWSDKIFFQISSTSVTSTTSVNDGAWHHVACVRASGTTMYVFVDGVLEGTSTSLSASTAMTMSGGRIGKSQYNDATDNAYIGYIDDLRITKGIARYTSNFTPPTSAFPTY